MGTEKLLFRFVKFRSETSSLLSESSPIVEVGKAGSNICSKTQTATCCARTGKL